MANRRQYLDFTWRYHYTGRDRNLTFVTQDQSPGTVSAERDNSRYCGCEVAIARGSAIKEIITRIDLYCKTSDAFEHKIREIERAIARHGHKSTIRRQGTNVEITTRVTKGPLGFPDIDRIRQQILVQIEDIVKQTPW